MERSCENEKVLLRVNGEKVQPTYSKK